MSLKFTGTFEELKEKLTSLVGSWDGSAAGRKVFRADIGGLLNWFSSTGTIRFQGKPEEAQQLERKVSHILYPTEFIAEEVSEQLKLKASEIVCRGDEPIESQYLYGKYTDTELIIGVVNAIGTEVSRVLEPLKNGLKQFGYCVEEVKVSALLSSTELPPEGEYDRIKKFMGRGDEFRKKSNDNSILAAGAIKEINSRRNKITTAKTVYIVNSLKHPEEIVLLRRVYAQGFFTIGIHSDEKRRVDYLVNEKGFKQQEAVELIKIDEDEAIPHGQRTRDTYHLSDFFISVGNNDDQVKNTIRRFLDLLFSHPYTNSTFDEFAMFMAFNSSIRSSDLSRQVGAVIARNNQIIATGANDTPKSGGGQYWAEQNSSTGKIEDEMGGKDYTRERDSNKTEQEDIITKILSSVSKECIVSDADTEKLKTILKESRISDLTEFGRVVHAEMDALMSCSREGISTVGATLYCTTFPCHNCAKHIISAGIQRVVYVEPYPKSKALELHSDSISLSNQPDGDNATNRVVFEPFTGIGARRFLDLFSMSLGSGSKLKRKDSNGNIVEWDKDKASLRVPLVPKSYVEIESAAISRFDSINKNP